MKNLMLLCLLSLAISLPTLQAQQALALKTATEITKEPLVKWDKTTFDFGEITQGVPVKATFTLTNNSDQALILKTVKPSCGCTVASYEQEPIPPGASTEIKAEYNAKKAGNFQKTVKVSTNLHDQAIVLKLKGVVLAN